MIDSPFVFFFKLFGIVALCQAAGSLAQWHFNRKFHTRKDAVRFLANALPTILGIGGAIAAQYFIVIGQIIIATPNLIEPRRSVAEAQAAVERSGLRFQVADEIFNDDIDAQLIVSQKPKPGVYLALGKPVDAIVSRGPKPTLTILSPVAETPISFPPVPAICSATATGKVTPLRQVQLPGQKLLLYLLLYPLDPYGGGWWVMDEPIDVDTDGNWTCHYQLGYEGAQPKTGDKFKLRVVAVDDRSNLPRLKEPIANVPDDSVIVSSPDVIITVERKQN